MTAEDPRIARLRQENILDRDDISNPYERGKHDPDDLAALIAAYDDRGRQIDAALALQKRDEGMGNMSVDARSLHNILTNAPEKPEGEIS